MPAMPMDDGGWGQIAAGLADAIAPDPYKRARMMLAGATYRKTELETERERQQQAAIRGSVEAYPDTVPAFPEGPASPQRQAMLDAQRRLRIADNAAATWAAKSASDYAQGVHANRGMGAIGAGIPSDPGQQDVIQTQISSIGGSLPNYAATPHTYQTLDASGQPQGAPITSRRMPDEPATLLAPKSQTIDTKGLGDETYRLTKIKEAIDTIETMGPGSLTPAKLRETELAIATQWPQAVKYETDARGNKVLIGYEDKAIPRIVSKVLADINSQYASAPPAALPSAAPAAMPFPALGAGVTPSPDALAGSPAAAPAAPAAGAFAAPPPPIVPAGALPQTAGAPGQVTVTQLPGGGGPATHEAANTARQVELAQQARLKLQEKIGYDEATGQLKPGYYVPGLTATAIGERYGGSATGRAIVKRIDPAAQEYRAEAMRWIEPVLRNASGAAIRPEEYGDYFAMFIPETGDSPQEVTRKLGAMKAWEAATAGAATANQALARMDQIAQQAGDPAMRQAADRIRVVARERGTLDAPLATGGGGGSAVAAPAAVAAPVVDHNAVKERLRSLGLM